MTVQHKRLFAVTGLAVVGLALAALQYWDRERPELEFQGWVEAELIFVSAEEPGRLETLSVREGDGVEVGSPLFALDADLQRAAVAENEAAVVNARQTYERAQALLKRAVGSQKSFRRCRGDAAFGGGETEFDAHPPGAAQGRKPGDG